MYLLHIIRYIVNVVMDNDPGSHSVFAIAFRNIGERIANCQIGHSSTEFCEKKREFIHIRNINNMLPMF